MIGIYVASWVFWMIATVYYVVAGALSVGLHVVVCGCYGVPYRKGVFTHCQGVLGGGQGVLIEQMLFQ